MAGNSIFQPDHSGKHTSLPMHHASHGGGDAINGHAVPGNIARDGAPKQVRAVQIHGGMAKQTKSGTLARGGDHASAIDSLSGNVVAPGRVSSVPGWGNSGVQNGHPLAKAPSGKTLKPAPVAFGQRSRGPTPDNAMHELGAAMLAEAFAASSPDDRQAHGRKR